MKYLSIDLEATGLDENCHIIEFAMVPFDGSQKIIERSLARHCFVQCPPFEELKPSLHPWVIEHNKSLIEKAHSVGKPLESFKKFLEQEISSAAYQKFFEGEKIILFGKSMNAIDLPFLNRDLGWDFIRTLFHHKVLDLSSFAYGLVDIGILKPGQESSSELMKLMNKGNVAHTALEDAINTADIYLKLLDLVQSQIAVQTC